MPRDVFLELRDTAGVVRRRFKDEIASLSWRYDRVGGCGEWECSLLLPYGDTGGIGPDWEARILVEKKIAPGFKVWHAGYVDQVGTTLSVPETVSIGGQGYVSQLKRPIFTETFSVMEVSSIVVEIANSHVAPNTDISVGSIEATGITAQTVVFNNVSPFDALTTLANLAGSREWGVDRNKKLFFAGRVNSVHFHIFPGQTLEGLDRRERHDTIVNRVEVEVGESFAAADSGTTIKLTREDSASVVKFGLRTQVVSEPSLVTSVDAAQLGDAILTLNKDIRREAVVSFADLDPFLDVSVRSKVKWGQVKWGEAVWGSAFGSAGPIEIDIPLGRVATRLGEAKKWGAPIWGDGTIWGRGIAFQFASLQYLWTDNGIRLDMDLDIGPPDLALGIRQILADIEGLKQRSTN